MRAVRNYEQGTGDGRSGGRGVAIMMRLALVAVLIAGVWRFGAPHAAARYNAKGMAALAAGRPNDAISDFEWAAWFAPKQREVRTNLFNAYQDVGKFAEAAREAEQMAKIAPADAAKWNEAKEALLTAARYSADAEKRLARMRADGWQDDDATPEVTLQAAETLFQIGRYTDAIMVYERLLYKTPHDWGIEEWIQELERRVREGETLTDDPDGPRATGLGGADEALRIER